MSRHLVSAVLTATALAACGGEDSTGPDSDEPRIPAAVADLSGTDLTGTVGAELANPLRVRVTDSTGAPVSGVAVDFQVATGGGQITEIPTTQTSSAAAFSRTAVRAVVDSTDDNGEAQVRWTLGTTAGEQRVTVLIPGVPTLNITAVAEAGQPAVLTLLARAAVAGIAGQAADGPLAVQVHDEFDNPVSGVPVSWAALSGGSVGAMTSETDEQGEAEVSVQLGTDAGLYLYTASVGDLGTDTIGVVAVTGVSDPSGDVGTGPPGTTLPDASFIGTALLADSTLIMYLRFADPVSPTPVNGPPEGNSVVPIVEFDLDRDSTTGRWPFRRCPDLQLDSLGFGVDLFVFGDPRLADALLPNAPDGGYYVFVVDSLLTGDRCGDTQGFEGATVPLFRDNSLVFGLDASGVLDDGVFDVTSLFALAQDGGPSLLSDIAPDSLPATFDVTAGGMSPSGLAELHRAVSHRVPLVVWNPEAVQLRRLPFYRRSRVAEHRAAFETADPSG